MAPHWLPLILCLVAGSAFPQTDTDLEKLIAAERNRALHLLEVDGRERSYATIALLAWTQLGVELQPEDLAAVRPEGAPPEPIPLRELLDTMGLEVSGVYGSSYSVRPRAEMPPSRERHGIGFIAGGAVEVRARPYPWHGERQGWIVEVKPQVDVGAAEIRLESVRLEDGEGRAVAAESCPRHRSALLFVPGDLPGGCFVKVGGVCTWYAPVEVVFEQPDSGTPAGSVL